MTSLTFDTTEFPFYQLAQQLLRLQCVLACCRDGGVGARLVQPLNYRSLYRLARQTCLTCNTEPQ
jgi:hypothetical protein